METNNRNLRLQQHVVLLNVWSVLRINKKIICFLKLYSLATLRTTRFNIQQFYILLTLSVCVLYGSQNRQRLFRYALLADWFCIIQG
jgi:hypothetical protein